MGNSALFYKSVNGIFEQKCASYEETNGRIVGHIRGRNNCKCALGQLIDDKDFNGQEGDLAVAHPMIAKSTKQQILGTAMYSILHGLQLAHDGSIIQVIDGREVINSDEKFLELFMEKAARIAKAYDLVYQP